MSDVYELNDDFIIHEVYARPELWNKKLGINYNKNRAWGILSEKLEVPVDVLKKRWKVLRDCFVRNIVKIPKSELENSSDPLNYEPYVNWPLFGSLLFLKDHISHHKPSAWQQLLAENEQNDISLDDFSSEQLETSTTFNRCPDEDDYFVSSLLSHLRRIDPSKKLLCRMEIQRVVNEYAYGHSRLPQKHLDLEGLVRESCEGLSEEYLTEEINPSQM
ncbi:uncharacterized protein LOC129753400 [Uranotaenia lowii]|uniref:uncharacterized protein LOC129753400 n=1 Tax=Uranotaenia lowii TaxID=190385 RepID=UPI0024789B84|nr:uncharacterized protein LOC129753400 [Uranotaenia lowii]